MYSRRDFAKIAAGSIPLARGLWAVNSTIHGVRVALQSASFSFSGIGIEGIVKTMVDLGIAEIDVMSEHVENFLGAPVALPGAGRPGPWTRRAGTPPAAAPGGAAGGAPGGSGGAGRGGDPAAREALRKWRMEADLDKFRAVGKRFTDAGLRFFAYNLSFNDTFTDDEIEKGFLMTKALGTSIITASSPASIFPRIAPFAEKHNVVVAMHNHTTGPEEFEQAMAASRKIWVNLDLGHFLALGNDPIAYIKKHHARITNIHLKDRKKDRGPEMPFGEGDTPLKEALQLLKKEKYGFPACIELVGPDGPAVELKRCFDYCRAALA